MNKRTVLYARVSTDDQADKGYSLPSQLDLCRKYAERLDYSVVSELTEDFTGAVPIAERPTGRQLAAMVKARQVDVLIVYQVDRLSRDIVNLLATVQTWLRSGLEIHTCDIGKIESELDIVLVIKGWQGSDERKKIIERTTRGRNGKAKTGKAVGAGFAPFGYRYADGELIVVEDEAGVVRLIYIWYVKGEQNEKGDWVQIPTLEICRRLQALGVPVPSQHHFWKVRGGVWTPAILYKILKSETYKGIWYWGKNIGSGGRGGRRDKSEQIAVSVPAIIDAKLWKAAQDKREYNQAKSMRRARHNYLLRRMIVCECGLRMIGKHRSDSKLEDPRYYVCQTVHQTWVKRTCKQKSIRAGKIETRVWEYVKGLMENATQYEDLLREAQRAEEDALTPKQEELATVEKLFADCEQEAAQCAAALLKASGAVGRALEEKTREINARFDALSKRRGELQAELTKRQLTDEAVNAALSFRQDVVAGIQDPTFETKRRVLEMLGVQVKIEAGTYRVNCRVGTSRAEFDLQTF
jgi:site-specific DNA recombinase